jgi:MOSC domain-containing protein YiiM
MDALSRSTVAAVLVGLPWTHGREGAVDPADRPWNSAIVKHHVDAPARLGFTNLEGDQQADRRVHGGTEKAVLAYAAAHYPFWRKRLDLPDLAFGAFGENFAVDGLDETGVCIGDIFAIGSIYLQVSQPRLPCWKLSRRWRIRGLAEQVLTLGRTGWYFRVLQEGYVEAGQPLVMVERVRPEWTIAQLLQLRTAPRTDLVAVADLADDPLLAESWRSVFRKLLTPQVAAPWPAPCSSPIAQGFPSPDADRKPIAAPLTGVPFEKDVTNDT